MFQDMGKCRRGKILDRRNPFGHYDPENSQWATPKYQAKNQRQHWVKNHTPEEIEAIELEAKECFEGKFTC
ncbi:MAG: hypothetical protein WAL95_01035 [Candidatus Acidiferrales bacterium]